MEEQGDFHAGFQLVAFQERDDKDADWDDDDFGVEAEEDADEVHFFDCAHFFGVKEPLPALTDAGPEDGCTDILPSAGPDLAFETQKKKDTKEKKEKKDGDKGKKRKRDEGDDAVASTPRGSASSTTPPSTHAPPQKLAGITRRIRLDPDAKDWINLQVQTWQLENDAAGNVPKETKWYHAMRALGIEKRFINPDSCLDVVRSHVKGNLALFQGGG